MKSGLSLLKIVYLSILLAANVIGFHYYYTPVATENLNYIPAERKLVLTLNLKTISGKLFEEVIFHPDEFEEELITKDEKKLVFKNTNFGINPFGLVSFFVFPYQNKMVNGVSLNLQDQDEFIDEMEKAGNKKQTVDGVMVFQNEKNTFFVYEKAVVILFSVFTESQNESLAVEVLMNDDLKNTWSIENDFQLITQKGLLANSTFSSYLNLIPDFMQSSVLNGTFETGTIHLNGFFNMNGETPLKEEKRLISEELSIKKEIPFYVHLSGSEFSPYFTEYLENIFQATKDTTGKLKGVLATSFHSLDIGISGIALNVDLMKLGTNLASGEWFQPTYEVNLDLASELKESTKQSMDQLQLTSDSLKGRKLNLSFANTPPSVASGYLYWNPSLFLEKSDLNIFIRNIIAPFIIFDEFILMLEEMKENKAFFRGEINFKDKEVHSLIQLRLLFKNLSSMI